jgi:HEAT repeat protein
VTVQLRCGRCEQTVSFEELSPDVVLFCPRCKEPLAAATKDSAAPWWIANGAPPEHKPTANTVVETKTISKSEAVSPPIRQAGKFDRRFLSIALIFGAIGFALAWLPSWWNRASRTTLQPEAVSPLASETINNSDRDNPQNPQRTAPALVDLLPLLEREKLAPVLNEREGKVRREHVAAVGEVGRRLLDRVGDLTDKLNDEDAGVRVAAAEALGKLGPWAKGAYPPLLHASKNDDDKTVQRAAQAALDRIGPLGPSDATLLTFALQYDGNANYRASVAQTLLTIGVLPDDAVRALQGALKDGEVRVRVFAAQALWLNRREAAEVVPVLRAALRESKDAAVRAGAAYALGAMGKAAREAIRELKEMLLSDADGEARLRAAEALYRLADDAVLVVPELRKLLADPSPMVRGLAAEALGRIGPRAASAVEELRGLLVKDDAQVQACAAFALGGIGKDAKVAVPELLVVLQSGKGPVREQSVAALAAIGPEAVAAVPVLIDMLHRESDTLRARAAFALGAMGRGARKAVEPLIRLLRESRAGGERLIFAQALWRIERDSETVLPVLLDLVKERDRRVRLAAIEVLGEMGSAARLAGPALQEARKDAAEEVRHAIDTAQEQIGVPTKEDITDLIKAVSSKNTTYRLAAAQTLLALGGDAADAVPALIEALKVHDPELRLAAIGVFGAVGEKAADAVPALVELLSVKDAEMQTAILDALAGMGAAALKAVPALTHLLKSDEHVLRASAAFALGSIGREPANATKAQQQNIRNALKDALTPIKDAALNDKDAGVRLYAAQALYILTRQTDPAVGVLKKCLNEPDEPGIRAAAAEALADIGPRCRDADKEIVPLLVQLTKTDREEVRSAAFDALKKIAPAEVAPARR